MQLFHTNSYNIRYIIIILLHIRNPYILELSPEEQAKRDKRLLKKEELSREHDKILAEIENHDKNSVNLALKKFVSP